MTFSNSEIEVHRQIYPPKLKGGWKEGKKGAGDTNRSIDLLLLFIDFNIIASLEKKM